MGTRKQTGAYGMLFVMVLALLIVSSCKKLLPGAGGPAPQAPAATATTPMPPAQPPAQAGNTITEAEIRATLDIWKLAQSARDVSAYAALYAPDFTGVKMSGGSETNYNYDGWIKDRSAMMSRAGCLRIDVADLRITPGPDGQARADFTQYYISDRYADKGPKEMKFKRSGGRVQIVWERLLSSQKVNGTCNGGGAAASPSYAPSGPYISDSEIRNMVQAWENTQDYKDFSGYAALYSGNFTGIKRTKSGKAKTYKYSNWIADREKMMSSTSCLDIVVENLSVYPGPSGSARAEFTQVYLSDSYADQGRKVLTFAKSGSDVLIVKEELLNSRPTDLTCGEGD